MSSRYLKDLEVRKSKIIHIYRNGDPYTRASFVILRLVEQSELERIIRAIEEKVKLPLNRPIRKLFEISGIVVQSPVQIKDGDYYVAASSENFSPVEYGHPKNWILVGPVKSNKYENVHYVTKAEEEGKPNILSISNSALSNAKTKNQNTPEKKLKVIKSDKVKKEGRTKKYAKNMIASEHADIILDDVEINKTSKKQDIQVKQTEYNINEHENVLDKQKTGNEIETNGKDIKQEIQDDIKSSERYQEDIESSEINQADVESAELILDNVVSSEIIPDDKEKFEYKEDLDKGFIGCNDDESVPQEPSSENQEEDINKASSGLEKLQDLDEPADSAPIVNAVADSSMDQHVMEMSKENTEEVDEIEKDNEVDKVDEVNKIYKVDKVDEIDKIDEVDKVDEVDEVDKVDKVDDLDKVDEVDSKIPQDFDEHNNIPDDMISDDVYNNAATKIQATFRGYQVRNEIGKTKTSDFPDDSIDENPSLSETTNVEDSI